MKHFLSRDEAVALVRKSAGKAPLSDDIAATIADAVIAAVEPGEIAGRYEAKARRATELSIAASSGELEDRTELNALRRELSAYFAEGEPAELREEFCLLFRVGKFIPHLKNLRESGMIDMAESDWDRFIEISTILQMNR